MDGVICSPLEAQLIHEQISPDFLTVTPGIRLETKVRDDQFRIASPAEAARLGSDYIVVGRPITQAKDPLAAYQSIQKSWIEALEKGAQ